ncbi:MAG: PPOX class F420-dependent oxidoreductase [Actinomycetota bacterium]
MKFTGDQLCYLDSQRLGRLATAQPNGTLQVTPVGFRYNSILGTIDIGGSHMAASKKFRNVKRNANVAFVVDDIASVDPWSVRCVEVRGYAEALEAPVNSVASPPGPIIRIHPQQIISMGDLLSVMEREPVANGSLA